jgi:hypothetical protein
MLSQRVLLGIFIFSEKKYDKNERFSKLIVYLCPNYNYCNI